MKSPGEKDFDRFVHQAADDWRSCELSPKVLKLAEFAEKLTKTPAACSEKDIQGLRAAGWSDEAIHDATQVISYFNYINRIVEGLGVEEEKNLPVWGKL